MRIIKDFLNSHKDKDIIVTIETFSSVDNKVGYGRNGQNELVSLQKTSIEFKEYNLMKNSLYIRSNSLTDKFGFIQFNSDNYGSEVSYDNVSCLTRRFRCIEKLGHEKTEERWKDLVSYWTRHGNFQEIDELINKEGQKITKHFIFTDRIDFYFIPQFVKKSKNNLIIGYRQVSTYNTLPVVIKFKVKKEKDYIKLKDLNIETTGSYDHYDNMLIRNEEKNKAVSFFNNFKRSSRVYEKQTLKKALK